MHVVASLQPNFITTKGFDDYELIDSGNGRKLERFGKVVVDRPEAQAIWQPSLSDARWQTADARFVGPGQDDDGERGRWTCRTAVPETWHLDVAGVRAVCRLMSFRHLGLFPEQLPHWMWMSAQLANAKRARAGQRPRVLNLFAYTGVASLVAAQAGAEVVHVDASKKAIGWARENQTASDLGDAPIRWIVEDARKFVAREVRRGRSYDLIIVDPPKFGRGTGGETWELFADLPGLLRDCEKLLGEEGAGLVLTVYAIRASTLTFHQLMKDVLGGRGGQFEFGELAIAPTNGGWQVPTSLYSRWVGEVGA